MTVPPTVAGGTFLTASANAVTKTQVGNSVNFQTATGTALSLEGLAVGATRTLTVAFSAQGHGSSQVSYSRCSVGIRNGSTGLASMVHIIWYPSASGASPQAITADTWNTDASATTPIGGGSTAANAQLVFFKVTLASVTDGTTNGTVTFASSSNGTVWKDVGTANISAALTGNFTTAGTYWVFGGVGNTSMTSDCQLLSWGPV